MSSGDGQVPRIVKSALMTSVFAATIIAVTTSTPVVAAGISNVTLFSADTNSVVSADGTIDVDSDGPTGLMWHDVVNGVGEAIGLDVNGNPMFSAPLHQYYVSGYSPTIDTAVQFTQNGNPLDIVYTENLATGTVTQVPVSLTREILAAMPSSCQSSQDTLPHPLKEAGREVLFTTYCPITADDDGDRSDTYLYNRDTQQFTLVSVPIDSPHDSLTFNYGGDISNDGRRVVYDVSAPIPYPPNSAQTRQLDVIVWDRDTNTRVNISSNQSTTTFGQSFGEQLSPDGNAVIFQSYRDEVPGTDTGWYIWDDTHGLRGIPPPAGEEPVAVHAEKFTPDSRFLTYTTDGEIGTYDISDGSTSTLLPPPSDGSKYNTVVLGISDDLNSALFFSNRTDLVSTPPQYGGIYRLVRDNVPPSITATPDRPPNAAGWYNAPVTVTFTCADAQSGIATCPPPVTVSTDGLDQTVTGTATDNAGNSASAEATISVDQTSPTITGTELGTANSAGWYNAPVTIHYTCQDSLSGVASCPADVMLSDDGEDQTVSRTAIDIAGNTATNTTSGIDIDQTPPVVSVTGPQQGRTYLDGQVPPAGCSTTDALSGVLTQATVSVVHEQNGSTTVTCAGAEDVAGNVAPGVSVDYTVVAPVQAIATNTRSSIVNNSIVATVGASPVSVGDTLAVSVTTGPLTGQGSCSDSRGNSYSTVVDKTAIGGRLIMCTANVTHPSAAETPAP